MRLKEPLIVYLKKLGVQGEAGREGRGGGWALEDDEINFNSRYPPTSIFTRAYGLSSDALFLRVVNNLFLIIENVVLKMTKTKYMGGGDQSVFFQYNSDRGYPRNCRSAKRGKT